MKKYVIYSLCVLLIMLVACGRKNDGEQPNVTGQVEGRVDFTTETPKVEIGNVFAYIGEDIDYTNGLELLLGDAYFEVQVNAADVRLDKPGTYDVEYTFQYGNETYLETIQVTILEKEQQNSSEELEQKTEAGTKPEEVTLFTEEDIGEIEINTEETNTETGSGTEETTTGMKTDMEMQTTGELVTRPEDNIWEEADLRNARIELLSGKVVTLVCTTERYIVSTKTETTIIKRQAYQYEVSKLIVSFSDGTRQVLETIEKKID